MDYGRNMGYILDRCKDTTIGYRTDVDQMDTPALACRPTDGSLLEGAYASSVYLYDNFGFVAGMGNELNKNNW